MLGKEDLRIVYHIAARLANMSTRVSEKKTGAKKTAGSARVPKKAGTKKPSGPTKSELYSAIADTTGLTKTQVTSVFDVLADGIQSALRGPGQINALPGLLKISKVRREARPARQGRNPFTGEPMAIKARPAAYAVRVQKPSKTWFKVPMGGHQAGPLKKHGSPRRP